MPTPKFLGGNDFIFNTVPTKNKINKQKKSNKIITGLKEPNELEKSNKNNKILMLLNYIIIFLIIILIYNLIAILSLNDSNRIFYIYKINELF